MTRWGLFAVTIGCIIMMYSQTYNDFSQKILYCICGVTVVCLGAFMIFDYTTELLQYQSKSAL